MTQKAHDYQWVHLFTSARCHKWFRGIKPDGTEGIAVCDYSGNTPDQTDDGVIWLDQKNVILIELEDDYATERKNYFRWCRVQNLRGHDNDGNVVSIGGTTGNEIFDLVNNLGIKAGCIDYRGRTTTIQPIQRNEGTIG